MSPNPTTAAINEIRMPDAEHSHGTVILLFKTEDQLLKDINQALELSGKTVGSIESLQLLLQKHDELVEKKLAPGKEGNGEGKKRTSGSARLPLCHLNSLPFCVPLSRAIKK